MGTNISKATCAVALLASLGATAHAAPIAFTNTSFDTTAYALSGTAADVNSGATPSPLPLISSGTVVGANDFATASALADSGLLVTSAEADSYAGGAGATAGGQSHFVGTVLGTGRLTLNLAFQTLNAIDGGTGDGTLYVLLTNTAAGVTTTLFNGFFDASRSDPLEFFANGGVSTLDLVLFSEATTTAAGQSAQNFAQVTVAGVLPAPETLPLMLGGLAGFLVVRRRKAPRAA